MFPVQHVDDFSTKAVVAYAARYYKPGRVRSRDEVYVCDLKGRKRRQISHGKASIWWVWWVGPDRLAWIDGQDLYTARYPLGRPRLVARHLGLDFDSPSYDLGNKSLFLGRRWFQASPKSGKLVPGHPPTDPYHVKQNLGKDAAHAVTLRGKKLTWTWDDEARTGMTLRSGDKSRHIVLRDSATGADILWDSKEERLFIVSRAYEGYHGHPQYVYRIDPDKLEANLVVRNGEDLEFSPSRTTFAHTCPRDLKPLDHGRVVWVSPLIVGDWTTGREKVLASGLVYVHSPTLRPER